MTAPKRTPVPRRKPTPKPVGEVAAEALAVEALPAVSVTVGCVEWTFVRAHSRIGYDLAVEWAEKTP